MRLDELAIKHNTDKSSKWHAYCEIYDTLFEKFRFRNINFLEIGISEGASLRMWADYFSGEANIYGIDIIPYNPKQYGELPANVKWIQCDQSKPEELEKLVEQTGKFDIIIDDGSHHIPYMLLTLKTLLPHLKDGGIYCIEDVQHYQEFNENLTGYNYWTAVSNSKIADNSHLIIIRK